MSAELVNRSAAHEATFAEQVSSLEVVTSPLSEDVDIQLAAAGSVLLIRTRNIPRLSPEEERELGAIVQASPTDEGITGRTDDPRQSAVDRFVLANQRLVRTVAGDFPTTPHFDIADLVQAGNEGLIKAARRYRPGVGAAFGTFASPHIRKTIQNHLIEVEYPVHVSRTVWEQLKVLTGIRSGFYYTHGRGPSLEEWSDAYHARWAAISDSDAQPPIVVNPDNLHYLLSVTSRLYSVDVGYIQRHDDPHQVDPEAAIIRKEYGAELRAVIEKARARMTERERAVFDMRLPQDDGKHMSDGAAGRALGISRTRVHQLENSAKGKLRGELSRYDPKYASYGVKSLGTQIAATHAANAKLPEGASTYAVEISRIPLPPTLGSMTDWLISTAGIFPEGFVEMLTDKQRRRICKALVHLVLADVATGSDSRQDYSRNEGEVVGSLLEPNGQQAVQRAFPDKSVAWMRQRAGFFMRRLWRLRDVMGVEALTNSIAGVASALAEAQTPHPQLPVDLPTSYCDELPRIRATPEAATEEIAAARARRRHEFAPRLPFDVATARAVIRIVNSHTSNPSSMFGGNSGGNCANVDPNEMFVTGAAQKRVKERICGGCTLRAICLGYALVNQMEWGVWGGMSEHERRAMHNKYPDIQAWAKLRLEAERY